MEYPLISEYREAVMMAEDSLGELAALRPVLDAYGSPVMSSGNFAVVFKMRDSVSGKLYALKCFTKEQAGRRESYRRIADELELVGGNYILPIRYLEKEIFVDSPQCECEEFPVVLMEWVEGENLDRYVARNIDDRYALEMLSYRFNRMAAWLLAQPFAHGDLKPDNILVREDGSLVLVDYDGMFVPSMQGEKARETGSPDYRHPLRTDSDFNEHIDDFAASVIALSLRAIALNPSLRASSSRKDTLLLSESDFRDPATSTLLAELQRLTFDTTLSTLLGLFWIALSRGSLDTVSFRLFLSDRPEKPIPEPEEVYSTEVTEEDIANGWTDEYGVVYSADRKRLLKAPTDIKEYTGLPETKVIGDCAFSWCESLTSIHLPEEITSIGDEAFDGCESLTSIHLPEGIISIGNWAFNGCKSLTSIEISNSLKSLGNNPFSSCNNLNIISPTDRYRIINGLLIDCESSTVISCLSNDNEIIVPDGIRHIGGGAFAGCKSLTSIHLLEGITSIGNSAFNGCMSLTSIHLPEGITSIGNLAFIGCESLTSIHLPEGITSIGDWAFSGCKAVTSIHLPEGITSIGNSAFNGCKSLLSIHVPEGITSIGDWAFSGCKFLLSIHVPEGITSIGNSAFNGCKSLSSIHLPEGITAIGNLAFDGCESLTSIHLPEGITSIGNLAFNGCKSLTSIDLPASVRSIGCVAFPYSCKVIRK